MTLVGWVGGWIRVGLGCDLDKREPIDQARTDPKEEELGERKWLGIEQGSFQPEVQVGKFTTLELLLKLSII